MTILDLLPWLLATRVVLSVTASGLQKRQLNDGEPTGGFWRATYGWMIPAALLALLLDSRPESWVSGTFWFNAVLAGLLDAAGNRLMLAALKQSDLSVFGPLTALRPVLALLFGWFFLSERPSWAGTAGIVITGLGALVLISRLGSPQGTERPDLRSLCLRTGGLALSTLASVFLKRAVQSGTPGMTLGIWILAGGLALEGLRRLAPAASPRPDAPRNGPWFPLHAATFFILQWLTIVIFQHSLLAYSFAFFQSAMVLQVLVGRFLFGEPAFGRRLLGCLVMGAGAVLIAWKG